MKKNKISSYLIFISIFSVLTIFALIMQKSYDNLVVPSKQVQVIDIGKDITSELDLSVIDQIKNRQHINPSDLPENEAATSDSLLITPTPVIASASAEPVGPIGNTPIAPTPTLIP